MVRKLLGPFLASESVTFSVPGSADRGVRLLSDVVGSVFFASFRRPGLVGRVDDLGVSIRWHRPFVHNSFGPVFSGKFLTSQGQTVLSGQFAMQPFTKIMMSLFLLASAVFWVLVLTKLPRATNPPAEKVMFVFLPLAMIAACVGFVHLGTWFARHDAQLIKHEIKSALGHGGT